MAQLSEEKASTLDDNDDEDKRVSYSRVIVQFYTHFHHQIINEEEAWETVRDMIKEQEDATAESWTDELDNLLVFVSIFVSFLPTLAEALQNRLVSTQPSSRRSRLNPMHGYNRTLVTLPICC